MKLPVEIKAIVDKFLAQPGSIKVLLAASVVVLLITLLAPSSQNPASQQTSSPQHSTPEPVPLADANSSAASEPVTVTAEADVTETSAEEPASVADFTPPPAIEPPPADSAQAKLVLIIDDIGYNAAAGQRAIDLPGQVTYAVIPYTPHGKALAHSAFAANKEVMLHVPMSNLSGMDLGQGGLTLQQDEQEFMYTLQAALADIPHIKGVNNHTGSELTAAPQPMQWLMQELKNRDLFFVDSVTTSASVAAATAEQYQVPSLRRHVFLDNVQTAEAIDAEFRRALAIAHNQGFAVAIGHPYAQTLAYLEEALPLLAQQNIQLISASSMIARLQQPAAVETTAAW